MDKLIELYTFIAYLIIGMLYCFGVFKIFDDVLISIRANLELKLGKWSKPLVSCPPCMGSFHGFYLGIIFFGLSWNIPLYCMCLCGVNYLVNTFIPEYE